MAQGRGLLKIARLEDETVENRRLHALRIARLRFLRVTSGRRKGKIKIKVKGSGRECPLYTRTVTAGYGWTVRNLRFR